MRFFLGIGALMGAQAVITGALAAHGDLSDYAKELVEKAIQYEMWHAIVLIGIALLLGQTPSRLLMVSGVFFVTGVLTFCGSLYMLGFSGQALFPFSAPIGGSCLILGWLSLAAYAGTLRRKPSP